MLGNYFKNPHQNKEAVWKSLKYGYLKKG
jgi:hypothetical protein